MQHTTYHCRRHHRGHVARHECSIHLRWSTLCGLYPCLEMRRWMKIAATDPLAFTFHVVHADCDVAIQARCYWRWRVSKRTNAFLVRADVIHEVTTNLQKICDSWQISCVWCQDSLLARFFPHNPMFIGLNPYSVKLHFEWRELVALCISRHKNHRLRSSRGRSWTLLNKQKLPSVQNLPWDAR